MTRFKEASPLQASLDLKKAVMRFYRDAAVPVVDDWGSCVGIVHREDCNQVVISKISLKYNLTYSRTTKNQKELSCCLPKIESQVSLSLFLS